MEVRFFKRSERQLLLDSIDRLWRHDHIYVRKPEVLEHLVLNTPYREEYAGEDNYSVAGIWDDTGRVVGIQGAIPQRFNVFGTEYASRCGTIWKVDKNSRRINGLVTRNFLDKRGARIVLALGLSKDSFRLHKAYGAYMIENLPRWIGINREKETVRHLLEKECSLSLLPRITHIEIDGEFTVECNELDSQKWDRYYFGFFAHRFVGTQRDYRFLKWRYMESPILKYDFIAVKDKKGDYLGLAVVREEKILDNKFSMGRILEFISVNAAASVALAEAVISHFPNVLAWDYYCLSGLTVYGLEMVGMRRIPDWNESFLMPTRFQPIDHEQLSVNGAVFMDEKIKEKLGHLADIPWYITRGDADQDRAN